MNSDLFKSIFAGLARHALTTLGGILVADGVMSTSQDSQFIGAGMVLTGIAWSWYQKVGSAEIAALLKKVTARGSIVEAKHVAATTTTIVRILIAAFAISAFLPVASRAASLPQQSSAVTALNSALSQPYTLTACGAYFGVNTIGSTNAVKGDVAPGTQVVQGGIGGTVGYGCPINAATGSFWFAEAMADVENLNGASNGLSLSGPVSFTERFGAGTPLNQLLGLLLPSGTSSPAIPSLPLLPNGITTGPAAPYAYVALHQKDISLSNGLSANREWLLSWGVGLGLRYRLSNGVVADTFAEYDANTSAICVGPLGGSACARPGQGAQVGLAFLY